MAAPIEMLVFVEQILESDSDSDDDDEDLIILTAFHPRRVAPKIYQFYELILSHLELDTFCYHCRLSRATFDILLAETREYLLPVQEYSGPPTVCPEKQLFVFVWYIANQSSMRNIALTFGLSKATVHEIVHHVSAVLSAISHKFIKWPDAQRKRKIKAAFKLPGVVGVIDGSHIKIMNPCGEDDRSYFNRKKYHSVHLQLIVDDLKMINDVYVGFPGSAHDARVFRNSPIFEKLEAGLLEEDEHILGDSAYPVKLCLIPPYRDNGNLTFNQRRFNTALSSDRQVVEHAIGHLKGRFRKIRDIPFQDQSGNRLQCMTRINQFILAACVLHNMCILAEDDLEQFIDLDALNDQPHNVGNELVNAAAGHHKRNALMLRV